MTDHQTQQTYTVRQAAAHFGVSDDAILKRIKRGSLAAVKDDSGQWCITLPDATDRHSADMSPTGQAASGAVSGGETAHEVEIRLLREQLAAVEGERDFLRERLEASQQGEADLRRLIDQQQQLALPAAVQSMPALIDQADQPRKWWQVFRRKV